MSSVSLCHYPLAFATALSLGLVFQVASTGPLQAAQAAPTPAPAAGPPARTALFATDLASGKDPFFPESRRLSPGNSQKDPAAVPVPGDQLKLKGIALGEKRRLALVNNQTLAEGEKASVKLGASSVAIQCLEIRERSAVILIVATREAKELFLAKDL